MITFVSLFLGLVLGPQPVEVAVGEGVATVKIVLNDERLRRIRGAPWTMTCDFGPELVPQKLEAVAYDAAGREIDRAVQWINLPQAPAVATVVLEPHREGEPRIARLRWESRARTVPSSVAASFDGQPLVVDDPHRLVLPPHDLRQLHFLRVELDFGDVTSAVELVFGGTFADQVSTEMTAIPVLTVRRGREPPPVAELRGWFLRRGEPVEVVAVEKGPAEVMVVQNQPFKPLADRSGLAHRGRLKVAGPAALATHVRLRFLIPVPQGHEGIDTRFSLFPASAPYAVGYGDLYWPLTRVRLPGLKADRQHLADAVAVAGLAAYERRRRRAVLLILSSEPDDAGQLTPAQARHYLERLQVPLVFWTRDRKPSPALAPWGEPVRIALTPDFRAAASALYALLDRQWLVWLNGTYLPQEITLAPEAEGITTLH